jgi:hypothetical protein
MMMMMTTTTIIMGSSLDIIIKYKAVKVCLLIDVAISSDKNIVQREVEKE